MFYEVRLPELVEAAKGIYQEFRRYNDLLEKQTGEVVIGVRGGVAEVDQNPHNIDVKIIDYDNED